MKQVLIALVIVASAAVWTRADSAETLADQFWSKGELAQGEEALAARLNAQKDDDPTRIALGVTQFLRGVEHLTQSLHTYGLRVQGGEMIDLPILRLPTPPNPDPKEIAYDDTRAILNTWISDLNRAEKTLAEVKSKDVKLPMRVGMIRLDLDGNGEKSDEETFWRIFARVQPRAGIDEKNASEFAVAFDAGDVAWLRGYCHLMAGLGEIVLAYDGHELFEATAHLFFEKVKSPHAYLQQGVKVADFGGSIDILDAIAFVHLLRMPLKEPERLQAALAHFQSTIAMSRASWKSILAETDNDREWIPNPKQKSVMMNLTVSDQMISSWMTFLDEMDDLLAGRRLAPFWRSNDGRGVNIHRIFTEPRQFDLVLWAQGTGLTPYLENGELTRRDVWRGIERAFGGDFLGFAAWFN